MTKLGEKAKNLIGYSYHHLSCYEKPHGVILAYGFVSLFLLSLNENILPRYKSDIKEAKKTVDEDDLDEKKLDEELRKLEL